MRHRADLAFPPPGRLVPVEGARRIQIDCRGSGSPTVVLESGLDHLGSLAWLSVHDSLAGTTRVCAYSRAGIMWSDPAPGDFDSETAARDLHTALVVAGETSPWVMVGHSLGAPYVMTFTGVYPAEVSGLVFVDPSHPDQLDRFREATGKSLAPSTAEVRVGVALAWTGILRLLPGETRSSWPRIVVTASAAFLPVSLRALRNEAIALPATLIAARARRQFADRPLIVLTATDALPTSALAAMGLTREQGDRLQGAQRRLHEDLAAASRKGRLELVPNSSHYVQFDRPAVVIRAIREVVAAVRLGK